MLAGNLLPNILSLVILAWAFKFAAYAEMNQGIVSSLNALAGVYSMIWFYFSFNEIISFAQMAGMFLMFVSVVLLALEGTMGGNKPVQVANF